MSKQRIAFLVIALIGYLPFLAPVFPTAIESKSLENNKNKIADPAPLPPVINPLAQAGQFNFFIEGNMESRNGDIEGTGAIGGNLTLNGDLEYSINNGTTYQESNVFDDLVDGTYQIMVRNGSSGCEISYGSNVVLTDPTCGEICDNNIDDDGDGEIDCADAECGKPSNITVDATSPSNCPSLDNGTIIITATGANLSYSIDGGVSYQTGNNFQGLEAGSYDITVLNTITGCSTDHTSTVTLTDPTCAAAVEVCGTLWEDHNQNGIIDEINNSRLSGIKVELYTCDNTLLATTATDIYGTYLFTNLEPFLAQSNAACEDGLPAGTYQVKFLVPDCTKWIQCLNGQELLITGVESQNCVDFGLIPIM